MRFVSFMKSILRLKTWILFILFFVPSLFNLLLLSTISVAAWLIWIYAIVVGGQRLLEKESLVSANTKLFRFNFFYLSLYLSAELVFNLMQKDIGNPSFSLLIIPVFYSGFAAFQVIYSAGITVSQLNLKRKVSFWNDSLFDFICLVFFPLGVWRIQPILRKAVLGK
jgi:hypothetical protein